MACRKLFEARSCPRLRLLRFRFAPLKISRFTSRSRAAAGLVPLTRAVSALIAVIAAHICVRPRSLGAPSYRFRVPANDPTFSSKLNSCSIVPSPSGSNCTGSETYDGRFVRRRGEGGQSALFEPKRSGRQNPRDALLDLRESVLSFAKSPKPGSCGARLPDRFIATAPVAELRLARGNHCFTWNSCEQSHPVRATVHRAILPTRPTPRMFHVEQLKKLNETPPRIADRPKRAA